jgi:hypothetical protein
MCESTFDELKARVVGSLKDQPRKPAKRAERNAATAKPTAKAKAHVRKKA